MEHATFNYVYKHLSDEVSIRVDRLSKIIKACKTKSDLDGMSEHIKRLTDEKDEFMKMQSDISKNHRSPKKVVDEDVEKIKKRIQNNADSIHEKLHSQLEDIMYEVDFLTDINDWFCG